MDADPDLRHSVQDRGLQVEHHTGKYVVILIVEELHRIIVVDVGRQRHETPQIAPREIREIEPRCHFEIFHAHMMACR